jgi:cyanophycinase
MISSAEEEYVTRIISVAAAGSAFLLFAFGLPAPGTSQEVTEYGPAKGALVIVGGGATTEIIERFIELGGGAEEGRFIIVPTAGGNYDEDGYPKAYNEGTVLAPWRNLRVQNVSMLHTHDPNVADSEEFVAELRHATAVWFNGGRQWNIVDSYAGTRTYDEFHRVLERGGVIGGSSAGATIQGEYLVRGDPDGVEIVMTDEEEYRLGFEFLRKSAIDPHIDTRDRLEDIVPVVEEHPHLLGIGLSEATALIVTGDVFEVLGESIVAVHDNTRAYSWGRPSLFLIDGDVYDMRARRIVAPDGG